MMVRAVVSLGSNVGDRSANLKRAIELLSDLPETKLVKVSGVIETEPVDVPEEFSRMKFLNQAAVFETDLSPHEFSDRMHAIEDDMGRVRLVRNGPRTIDIDLIDFGGVEMNDPDLILPHPRAKERAFVLVPLAELGVELK
jgi:2-amino-4-hydroxy-6-hydroxymethyldihydropteridine diphosphokinase